MDLYRQEGSKYWTADFTISGRRIRKSTKQTTKAKAMEVAAEFIRQAQRDEMPIRQGPAPRLREFVEERFLPYLKASTLDQNTKRYYQTGWRLLSETKAASWRLDSIVPAEVDMLSFSHSGANANCALRTLRRILSLGRDWGVVQNVPRISLRKERERSAVFDADMENQLLAVAPQPLKDVFIICHDTGMRPDEIIRMRWDDVLWDKSLIFIPDGKTETARRYVALSDRVRNLLRVRAQDTKSEWVFPSTRKKGSHMSYFPVAKQFSKARKDAGLPNSLVLYSARHSFATDMLDKTGNIVLVGKMLGHRSVTTTQRYLHPELKDIANLVNERNRTNQDAVLRHSLRHSSASVQ